MDACNDDQLRMDLLLVVDGQATNPKIDLPFAFGQRFSNI